MGSVFDFGDLTTRSSTTAEPITLDTLTGWLRALEKPRSPGILPEGWTLAFRHRSDLEAALGVRISQALPNAREALFGFPVVVDPTLPEGTFELRPLTARLQIERSRERAPRSWTEGL